MNKPMSNRRGIATAIKSIYAPWHNDTYQVTLFMRINMKLP